MQIKRNGGGGERFQTMTERKVRKRNSNVPEEFERKVGNLPAESGWGLAVQGREGVGRTPPGEPPASTGLGGRLLRLVRHLVTIHCPIYTVQWIKCYLPSFPGRRKFTEAPGGCVKATIWARDYPIRSLLLWSQEEVGNCTFLVALHLIHSPCDVKLHFFSIKIRPFSILSSFSKCFFPFF